MNLKKNMSIVTKITLQRLRMYALLCYLITQSSNICASTDLNRRFKVHKDHEIYKPSILKAAKYFNYMGKNQIAYNKLMLSSSSKQGQATNKATMIAIGDPSVRINKSLKHFVLLTTSTGVTLQIDVNFDENIHNSDF